MHFLSFSHEKIGRGAKKLEQFQFESQYTICSHVSIDTLIL